MLNIDIICVGKLKEKYLRDAYNEYEKRIRPYCKFNAIELSECKISEDPSDADIARVIEAEGKNILSKIRKGSYVVSMCIEGRQMSSEKLSSHIGDVALKGNSSITFIIGGSYGLCDTIKDISSLKLSVSKMTFPHQLFRVMLCEQIYRSFQILSGGKYHK